MFNEPTSGGSAIDPAVEAKSRAVAMLAMDDAPLLAAWDKLPTSTRLRYLTEEPEKMRLLDITGDDRVTSIRKILLMVMA